MKASEMTNEELANNTEEFANAFHNDSDKAILREAAARLRNVTVQSDNSAVIAYPVNNNGSFGGRARNSIPCTTIHDANGEVIANVIGSPVRNRNDAMRIANEICQSLNANADRRRLLKVAEDALAKLQDRFVSSVHDGTIDPYEALKIAEDALAAIREEGGGKPIRNCDRFETAEDAYNACPQFDDIDVKTMTDRELKIVEATTKCLEWLFAPIAEGGAK